MAERCHSGLTIANSRTDCAGSTGETCEYTCNDGYTEGPDPHRCGTNGVFEGGRCDADACTAGNQVEHARASCAGTTGSVCDFECQEGYSATGNHVCGADHVFSGGACEANECTLGTSISGSRTECRGVTGDECSYDCDAGYEASGIHVCMPSGRFVGGSCILTDRCAAGEDDCHEAATCAYVGPGNHSWYLGLTHDIKEIHGAQW